LEIDGHGAGFAGAKHSWIGNGITTPVGKWPVEILGKKIDNGDKTKENSVGVGFER